MAEAVTQAKPGGGGGGGGGTDPPPEGSKTFRNIGLHVIHPNVGDTIPPVGAGEYVDLTPEDEDYNRVLIDEGVLVDVAQYQSDLEEAEPAPQLAEAKAESKTAAKK